MNSKQRPTPPEWVTTTLLLEKLRDFQDDAWGEFTSRFRGPLFGYARANRLTPEEAEDVVQESLLAFAEAYRKGLFDRGRGRLRSWLFGFAHHKVVDVIRRRRRHQDRNESVGGRTSFWAEIADENEARDRFDQAWEDSLLDQCLARAQREFQESTWKPFELITLRGQSPDAVAEQLGMTRNSVYIAKHRILKRMRELRALLEEQTA